MPDGRAIRPSPRIDRAHCPPHMRRRPFGCPDAVSLKRPSKALYIAVRYKIAWVCRFCLWSQVIYGCKVPQLDPGSLCLQPMLARPLRAEAGDRIQSAYSASRNGWTHRMTDCARGPWKLPCFSALAADHGNPGLWAGRLPSEAPRAGKQRQIDGKR